MGFFRELKDQLSQDVKEIDNLDGNDRIQQNNNRVVNDQRNMEEMFSRNINPHDAMNDNIKQSDYHPSNGNMNNQNNVPNGDSNSYNNNYDAYSSNNYSDNNYSDNNYSQNNNVDDEISSIINSIVEMEEIAAKEDNFSADDVKEEATEDVSDFKASVEGRIEQKLKEKVDKSQYDDFRVQINQKKDENDMAGTVITKNTIIAGNISTVDNMEIYGAVRGDVECKGSLSIFGEVAGNATAVNICINTTKFEGDLISEGCVEVAEGTVVIGNITASSALISGAVKGEIDVCGPVILESSAVVKGNIKGKTVKIDDGAILQGFCELSHAETDIDNFFEPELSELDASNAIEGNESDDAKKKILAAASL